LIDLLVEMASSPPAEKGSEQKDTTMLEESFLSKFDGEERAHALEMIDIARASYQLRDDDNIFLARIEKQVMAPLEEAQRRIGINTRSDVGHLETAELVEVLRGKKTVQEKPAVQQKTPDRGEFNLRARQLVGQPAGPGLSHGKARVVLDNDQLFNMKAGEILVCDAIDPNMTFVVPMAAGIVERRGGMLIHGAIIAREYGLPCVTGVPDATSLIKTGDDITVDGFLGIVIIGKPTLSGEENH
jgi:pyruvate,water dikinase